LSSAAVSSGVSGGDLNIVSTIKKFFLFVLAWSVDEAVLRPPLIDE
jgi:hypothetical protein